MFKSLFKLTSYIIGLMILLSCKNTTEQIDQNTLTQQPVRIPVVCKQPVQVQDIWKLEPILVKNGEITESMTKVEKEQIIKSYIVRKNKQYETCLKGVKGK